MRHYTTNSTNNGKLIVLNTVHQIKNKETGEVTQVKPYFSESEKVDGKWSVLKTEKPLESFTADLTRVTLETHEIKKGDKVIDTKESVKLLFRSPDDSESYLLSLTWRMATRNLFNTLLGLQSFDNITISYWRNTAGYETFSVKQNGVPFKDGLLSFDEVKEKIKKVMFKGKEQTDTTELEAYLKDKLVELNEEIAAAPKSAPVEKPAASAEQAEEESELDF